MAKLASRVILAAAGLGALFAPLFAVASETGGYCERWKGRAFIAYAREGVDSVCISGCQATVVDIGGTTARYEVTGGRCASRKAQPTEAPRRAAVEVPEARAEDTTPSVVNVGNEAAIARREHGEDVSPRRVVPGRTVPVFR